MKSFEAVALCVGRDAEMMADVLGRKAITIRRWKQDPLQSGALNPVDSIERMMQTSLDLGRQAADALAPLNYLISRFSSHSVPHSTIHESFADVQLEASHLGKEYSSAVRDGRVSPDEARRLNREIEHMRQRLDEMAAVVAECQGA